MQPSNPQGQARNTDICPKRQRETRPRTSERRPSRSDIYESDSFARPAIVYKPIVTFFFELERQRLVARMDDAALVEHVHHVGHDVIQQPLVMGDDHRGILGRMEFRDARSDDAQRVDIQARIGLVENGQLRVEHRHLENLVFLLLAARETLVDGPRSELRRQLDDGTLFTHQSQELSGRKRLLTAVFALFVDGYLHEVGHRDARNLDRILEP